MKKIFIIEYWEKGEKEYALSLEEAKNHLEKQGYKMTQEFDENNNNSACFIFPETDFFAESKARIISHNLI